MDNNELLLAISEMMDEKLEPIKNDITNMKVDIINLKGDITNMKADIINIKLTLENETNRNVKIVAEGHLDLSQKLNETIRLASDIKAKQEIQDVYLNIHESKLRNII